MLLGGAHFSSKLDECLHTESGRTVLGVFPLLVDEGGSRDVPVGPGGVFGHEFLQEEGGGDGSRVASGVLEVGELVLERVGVFFFERHAPELLAAGFAAVDDLKGEFVVVAEESGDGIAEGADHCAREGGEVHDVRCSDFARFGKSVAKDEAAFGVRVVDHDGLAVLCLEDVARQHGLVADGVLGEAADGAHVDGELELMSNASLERCISFSDI